MLTVALLLLTSISNAIPQKSQPIPIHQSKIFTKPIAPSLSLRERLQAKVQQAPSNQGASLLFDLPITYNKRVSYWINHYQSKGKNWFSHWLERANRFMPFIQKDLKSNGLPQDLAYMVMIESGFEPNSVSHADAVGPWQFIQPTGERYGLKANWWLDERRDLRKSTLAAISYIRDLYSEFGSWYLVAASYNMGENGLRRQINKYKTKDFWELSRKGALPQETMDYVPKILAAMMIAKAPTLYGFRDSAKMDPLEYEVCSAPGGTDLNELADHIGVTHKSLKDLNAEILLGYIPIQVPKHMIRVPKGSISLVAEFLDEQVKARKK
jgi:membrane-bound lytic murein transglycosylase D